MRRWLWFVLASAAVVAASDPLQPSPEVLTYDVSEEAYTNPVGGLSTEEKRRFHRGDEGFEAEFGAEGEYPGLGSLYNNVSCESCHVGDGRGLPLYGDPQRRTMGVLKVSLPDGSPVPGIGLQFKDHAVSGHTPHGKVVLEWRRSTGYYGDGSPYTLQAPVLRVELEGGRPLPAGVLTSLRVAPPVFGAGLLEAIPEAAILALADPTDRDGDGIRGRPNWLQTPEGRRLGRFGLKANNPDLLAQNAGAFAEDMGVGNPAHPDLEGRRDEIGRELLEDVVFYTQALAVPARRNADDPRVRQGEALFARMGCQGCHTPRFVTGDTHPLKALRNKVIYPYTDLLLHDMGPHLADGRPDGSAGGQDWRTPPLWGIGLTAAVLGEERYLHDGRARTLEEAVLWHGGEAFRSKEAFRTAPKDERDALVAFLESL